MFVEDASQYLLWRAKAVFPPGLPGEVMRELPRPPRKQAKRAGRPRWCKYIEGHWRSRFLRGLPCDAVCRRRENAPAVAIEVTETTPRGHSVGSISHFDSARPLEGSSLYNGLGPRAAAIGAAGGGPTLARSSVTSILADGTRSAAGDRTNKRAQNEARNTEAGNRARRTKPEWR